MADELAIATVEKNGGKFTASYYDRGSIEAAVNPVDYFLKLYFEIWNEVGIVQVRLYLDISN